MAKGNMLLGRAVGSVGDITFSVVNGKQVIKAKPATAKGQYIKSCVIASTMGPGIKINQGKLS